MVHFGTADTIRSVHSVIATDASFAVSKEVSLHAAIESTDATSNVENPCQTDDEMRLPLQRSTSCVIFAADALPTHHAAQDEHYFLPCVCLLNGEDRPTRRR